MIEIIFWLWGLYGLLSGSLRVFGRFNYQGWYARLIGMLFMIPLPISLYLPRFLAEAGVKSTDTRFYYLLFEAIVLIIFVGGGMLFGNQMNKRQENPTQ